MKSTAERVEIVDLIATPERVEAGASVEVSWKTKHAESVALTANGAPVELGDSSAEGGAVSVVVEAETVFELTATGKEADDVATHRVTVKLLGDQPEILSFTANPSEVEQGDQTTISWKTHGADTIRLLDGALNDVDVGGQPAAEGSVTVQVSTSTTYKLVALKGEESAEATVVVKVKGAPTATLTGPAQIDHGQSATLRWEATDADSVSIVDDEDRIVVASTTEFSGSIVVSPSFTTTYRLVAVGNGKQAIASAMVAVKPVITTFEATDSAPVAVGAPKSLVWAVGGAREVEISNLSGETSTFTGDEAVQGADSMPVGVDGRFRLVARSGALETSRELTVEILTTPAISSFEAARPILTVDAEGRATATLTWSGVAGATRLRLDGEGIGSIDIGDQGLQGGSVDVVLEADETFTLTASNDSGDVAATATVRLVPEATIVAFGAAPVRVGAGEPFVLSWVTAGAVSIELLRGGELVPTEVDAVASGEVELQIASDSAFELRAYNGAGDFASSVLAVTVGAPVNTSFTATPDHLWVGETAILAWQNLGGTSLSVKRGSVELCATTVLAEVADGTCLATLDQEGRATFTLEVINGAGQRTSASVTVEAGTGPRIASFSVGPAQLLVGTNATISWTTTDDPDGTTPTLALVDDRGGSYSIPEGSEHQGSLPAVLAEVGDYTFTLTASTPSLASTPVSQSKTVTVVGLPAATLVASPVVFDTDVADHVTLSWTSANAASLVLYQLDGSGNPITPALLTVAAGDRSAGSFPVVPARATTYRIVATNALGNSAQAEASVTIAPPEILSFTAEPLEVVAGDQVTFEWTTKMATGTSLSVFESGLTFGESEDSYVDIKANGGTFLPLWQCNSTFETNDQGCATLSFPSGFTFPFGGADRKAMVVYVNGVVSFDLARTGNSYSTTTFPTTSSTYHYAHLAPFWVDLRFLPPSTVGDIWYKLGSDDRGRYLIVQWNHVAFTNQLGDLNFEIVLRETGEFEYRYGSMTDASRANGSTATIGYQTPNQSRYHVISRLSNVPGGLANRSFRYSALPSFEANDSYVWTPSVPGQRTVTLTAFGAGIATASVDVTIHPRATLAVTAPSGEVLEGEDFSLGWTSSNASAVEVLDESGAIRCTAAGDAIASGRCVLSEAVEGVYEYTVRATGALGSEVERVVSVQVYHRFEIEEFTVSESEVDYGTPVTLTWVSVGASEVTLTANGVGLDLGGKSVDGDSIAHTPARQTVYKITFSAADGRTREATRSVTVRTFSDFDLTASSDDVAPGTPVTLSWSGASLVPGQDVTFLAAAPMVPVTSAYVDISADPGATRIIAANVTSDDTWATVNLATAAPGFTFPYFGGTYDKLRVGIKGIVSFDTTLTGSTYYHNQRLPKADDSEGRYGQVALAAYWGDLQTRTNGGVFTKFVRGSDGPDAFIIQYHHMTVWSATTADINLQIVLYADGSMEYRYGSFSNTDAGHTNSTQGAAKTIGYQMPGGMIGYTVHYGGVWTSSPPASGIFPAGISNKAFRWEPMDPGTTSIVVQPSETTDYTVCAIVDGYRECRTVTVRADFSIDSFTTSSAGIDRGQTVDLTWATKGGDALSLKANGVEIANETDVAMAAGSLTHTPTATTTYVLELRNDYLQRTITSTKTVTVTQFELSLTASAPSVDPGGSVTLSWTADMFAGEPVALTTPMTEVLPPFVDISTTGATEIIGASSDSTMADVAFADGFTFNYLGKPYSAVRVSTDGFLTFDATATTAASNSTLPSTGNKKVHLAPFWKDLHTRTNGRVYALATATQVVVQWSHISMNAGSTATAEHDLNFQVVLGADGSFEYRYGTMAGLTAPNTSSNCYPTTCLNEANASSATIGYQEPTGVAGSLLYMGGTSNSANNFPFAGGLSNRSFRFTPFAGSGSVVVNPGDTTGYRICAISGTFIECTDLVTVTSEWKILSFGASASVVEPGQPVTLSWATVGGDDIRLSATVGTTVTPLDVSGQAVGSGSFSATPTAKTTYTFELRSMGRIKTATRTVETRNVAVSLSASTTTALPGEPVTLTWDVTSLGGGTPAMSSNIVVSEVASAYEDITTSGGTLLQNLGLGASTSTGYATVDFSAVGFSFPYFGQIYDRIKVGNQGILSFDTTLDGYRWSNYSLPSTDTNGIKVHFAPFWGDVQTAAAGSAAHPDGGVYAKFVSEPGTVDHYIIQYHHHRIYSATDGATDLNFQVVLFADGAVEYRYGDMLPLTGNNPVLGGSKTIGFQKPGGGWGYNVHYGNSSTTTYPGGFGHRSFRYEPMDPSGSRTVTASKTTTYNLCATEAGYTECKEVTVVVPVAGSAAITELMLDPAGGPAARWFQIRNLEKTPIDLEGWEIVSGEGSHVIAAPVVVPGGGFATFAASGAAGFTPNVTWGSDLALDPAGGSVALKAGSSVVASVTWGPTWTIPHGITLILDPSYHEKGAVSNDAFSRWCRGTASGSPGSLGKGCRFQGYDLDLGQPVPFIDIRQTGVTVDSMKANGVRTTVDLPFSMPIFGTSANRIIVSSTGWISFNASQTLTGGHYFAPTALPRPSTDTPEGPIFAAFWDDLGCSQTGAWDWQYEHRTLGANQVTILQWNNYARCSNTGGTTFQVQLSSNGDMAVVFRDIVAAAGSSAWDVYNGSNAWIGLEGPDRTQPITALYKTVKPLAGRSFRFIKR
ncbi:lamin tail domain-containing protein [Vulgatibacter incomptus]|uniref:LTD domain-containing protein n=1 Tax=Vulgatibacter incomptus TaxID=1391653 RepID=A0A0K1PA98_9BACT|nr:lamin tail domain-containing protein [Vulgatibacter incomptus]AKU90463.1 hypothetical protein AKJ08_0850 [Vulgatibacter incomptus]